MNEPEDDNILEPGMEPSPEELVQAHTSESPRRALLNKHLKWWDSMDYWFVPNARIGYESDFESQANSEYFLKTYPWLDKLGDAVSTNMVGFKLDSFEGFPSFDHRLDSIDEDEFQAFLDDADTAKHGEAIDSDAAYELEQKETQRWLEEEGGSDLRGALHEKFSTHGSFFHYLIEQLTPENFYEMFQALEKYPERHDGDSVWMDEENFAEEVPEEMIQALGSAEKLAQWEQVKRASYRKFSEALFTKSLSEAVAADPKWSERVMGFTPLDIEDLFLRLVPDSNYAVDGVPKWSFGKLDYGSPLEWFVTWDLSDEGWKSHYAVRRNIADAAGMVGQLLGPGGVHRWRPTEPKEQLDLPFERRTRTEADHARARAIADRLLEAGPKKPKQSSLPLEQPEIDPADIDPSQLVQMSYGDEKHVHENPVFRVIRISSEAALKRYMGHAKVPPYNWQVGDYFLVFPQGRTDPYYWVRNDRDNILSNVPEDMMEEVERVILLHYRKNFHPEDPSDSPDYDLLWPMFRLGGRSPMRHIIRKHVSPDDENTAEFAMHYGIHLLELGRWRSALKYLDIKPEYASPQGYRILIKDWTDVTDELFADTRDADHRKTAEKIFSGEARDWFWEHQAYVEPEEVAENLHPDEWKLVRAHINYMTLYPNGPDEEAVVMQPSVLAQYDNDAIVEWIKHQDEYDPDNELDELRTALKRIAAEVEIDSMESGMYNAAVEAIEQAFGSKGKWVKVGEKDVLEFIVPWSHIVKAYKNYIRSNEDWFGGGAWHLLTSGNEKFEFNEDFSYYGKSFGEAVNKPDSGWRDHASFYLSELPETEPPSDPNQPELSLDEPTTPTQPNESLAIS